MNHRAKRALVDFAVILVITLIIGLLLIKVGSARGARIAKPGNAQVTRLHRQLQFYGMGCFHVARFQFVCPLPAP